MRHATKALRCNGFVDGPNSAGSCYTLSYYTLLWKTCFKCPSREIHSPSGFAAILAYPWTVTNLFLFAPESLHDTALIQNPGDFCEAYFGVIFQCLPAVLLRLTKIRWQSVLDSAAQGLFQYKWLILAQTLLAKLETTLCLLYRKRQMDCKYGKDESAS